MNPRQGLAHSMHEAPVSGPEFGIQHLRQGQVMRIADGWQRQTPGQSESPAMQCRLPVQGDGKGKRGLLVFGYGDDQCLRPASAFHDDAMSPFGHLGQHLAEVYAGVGGSHGLFHALPPILINILINHHCITFR